MFNFNGITHILPCPNGKFSSCGSVPEPMLKSKEPTLSDVMAGRVQNGLAWSCRVFDTPEEWLDAAKQGNVKVCDNPNCACRNHF